ncbi:NAD(P)-binding protein [Myriangium duriaei CBS 260.36]|uniref:NAD(P)-binding protein n=1 Tax=Myriangium duriaei CBS 260.36 TaxID=1168546 RepID=A0A9P4IYQ5_9PEZI|nr:NAD(P)-binding protein [Myriangium duriaei CBS 260.36]
MAPGTLDFKCALVTGGGGGIGKAMAQHLISQGKKVIIAGRTEKKLQETSTEIGCQAYYVLDTGDVKAIPDFVQKITKEHPELDCLINNAGVQRPLDFIEMKPEDFLSKGDAEIDINIRGPMHLILLLLPHFKSKQYACIMNVSSILGFIPISVINPVYNGTKAWVHFFTMTLRTQLAKDKHNIKVVEIAPPTVSTDLHRERSDPDDNKKDKNSAALSVDEFMDEVSRGWSEGKDLISAGPGVEIVQKWVDAYGAQYEKSAH